MDEKFEKAFKLSFKSELKCKDEKLKIMLSEITNTLMDIAHDNEWFYDVERVLNEVAEEL